MANTSTTYHVRVHGMFNKSELIMSGQTPRMTIIKNAEEFKAEHFPYRDVYIVEVKETIIKAL